MRHPVRFLALGGLSGMIVVSAFLLVPAAPVAWSSTTAGGVATSTPSTVPEADIAARVVAAYQGDPTAGWDSPQQYQEWWPSACSAFALSAVLNAFGVETRPGLVLDAEIRQQAITPQDGLISLEGYANLVPRFYAGLDSIYYSHMQTGHLRQILEVGLPVLVNLWDPGGRSYHFESGHWLVVVGYRDHSPLPASGPAYDLRDSSAYHLTWVSAEVFSALFNATHRAVVVHRQGEVVP